MKPNQQSKISKKNQVLKMFDSISNEYDLINSIITFNSHKRWKREILKIAKKLNPKNALDIATGTADIAIQLGTLSNCKVIGIDISKKMLDIGRKKIKKNKLDHCILLQTGDAETLDYEDNFFDIITIGFGVRNFQDLEKGLKESLRVLNKKGTLIILETSIPKNKIIRFFYSLFTKTYIPLVSRFFSRDKSAYSYLINSAEVFPCGNDFAKILKKTGFNNIQINNKFFGSTSIYVCQK